MPYVRRIEGVVSGFAIVPQEGWGEEFLEDSDPELIAYIDSTAPTDDEIKRAQRKALADKMAESGAFEVLSYQALLFAVQETRTKYPAPTASLTDEQIIDVMSDSESPYYNAGFAKMKAYYDELSSL